LREIISVLPRVRNLVVSGKLFYLILILTIELSGIKALESSSLALAHFYEIQDNRCNRFLDAPEIHREGLYEGSFGKNTINV